MPGCSFQVGGFPLREASDRPSFFIWPHLDSVSPLSLVIIAIIIAGLVYTYKTGSIVSLSLVIINFAVYVPLFLVENWGDTTNIMECYNQLGFKATYLTGDGEWWSPISLFTSIFLHAGGFHLLMNMIVLILFGAPFEERVKSRTFAIIYFGGGLCGSLLYAILSLIQPVPDLLNPDIIGVGASGAIFAIMGGFVRLYPHDEIPLFLIIIFLSRVPVYIGALVFAAIETVFILAISGGTYADNTGHIVHLTSFAVGALMAPYVMTESPQTRMKKLKYDLGLLEPMAREQGLTSQLKALIDADEPELFDVWSDELYTRLACPDCKRKLGPPSGPGLSCDCGFRLLLVKKDQKGS